MELLIASLAVYKTLQLLDALSPREAMPWVKVLVGCALGYGATFALGLPNPALMGLTVAACAGIVHAVLRLLTLVGDMARKKSMR